MTTTTSKPRIRVIVQERMKEMGFTHIDGAIYSYKDKEYYIRFHCRENFAFNPNHSNVLIEKQEMEEILNNNKEAIIINYYKRTEIVTFNFIDKKVLTETKFKGEYHNTRTMNNVYQRYSNPIKVLKYIAYIKADEYQDLNYSYTKPVFNYNVTYLNEKDTHSNIRQII